MEMFRGSRSETESGLERASDKTERLSLSNTAAVLQKRHPNKCLAWVGIYILLLLLLLLL